MIPADRPLADVRFAGEPATARLVLGRTPAEAVDVIGLVHNLCGHAHRAAARAALGLPTTEDEAEGVFRECLRDHLLLVARMLPEALGLVVDPHLAADGLALRPGDAEAVAAFEDRLPVAALRDAVARFAEANGVAADRLQKPLEARLNGLHRSLAALADEDVSDWRARSPAPGEGSVLAPRGRLVHRAQISGGLVGAYEIHSPSRAVLAPGSALRLVVADLSGRGRLTMATARAVITLFDPCVAYEPVPLPEAAHHA